jgi:hypothetical protein
MGIQLKPRKSAALGAWIVRCIVQRMAQSRRSSGLAGLLGCLLINGACIANAPRDGSDPQPPDPSPPPVADDGDFVSSIDPGSASPALVFAGIPGSDMASYVPASDEDSVTSVPNAEVLQLSGDRLYTLSRFGGLSVIDASDPLALRNLGVYRSAGLPVDIVVEDGVVFAVFDGWSSYGCDAAGECGWHWASRAQMLDTRDAAQIRLIADLEVPGRIDGSRRVGDVLYVVADSAGCWGCGDELATTIMSFDLTDTSQLRQLDQLRLTDVGYVDRPGVTIGERRIYIAETVIAEAGGRLPSTLHVVDISDPAGRLVRGAAFGIGGSIVSSGQLDERDGVLRVLSQPGGWGAYEPPLLETFLINSSDDIQRAGSLTVALDATYDTLDVVRFDATRAYAGTNRKRASLHSFDLTDPAAPRQESDLTLPGPLYQLEPLGDRLLALGNDPSSADGSLSVSLFDVQDLEAPALLGRVAFGRDDHRIGVDDEDLVRLSVAPELGLIMVPFSAATLDPVTCQREHASGIQLIELGEATLTRRGLAPQVGRAQNVFLHRDRLFGVGAGSVRAFDIADRDAPALASRLHVSRNVGSVRVVGDELLRLGSDDFTEQNSFELTPLARASQAEPATALDLSELFAEDAPVCGGTWAWSGQVFVRGRYAYLPRYVQDTDRQDNTAEQQLTIYIVDIADPRAPRAVGRLPMPAATTREYFTGVAQTDNALVVGRVRYEPASYPSDTPKAHQATAGLHPGALGGVSPDVPVYSYDVIELADPAAPTIASHLDTPPWFGQEPSTVGRGRISVELRWGFHGGRGSSELTAGDMLIGSHAEAVEGQPLRAKYYLDRLDLSDPRQPRWLDPISIPGSVIAYDADTSRLLTLEYVDELEPGTSETCASRGYTGYFESEQNACRVVRRSIDAVTLEGDSAIRTSQISLDRERLATKIAVSSNRVFFTTSDFPSLSPSGEALAPPPGAVATGTITLETLERDGDQLVPRPSVELRRGTELGYDERLFARGDRAFEMAARRLTVVDTAEPESPTQQAHDLPDWGCAAFDVAGDTAYCAAGPWGVESIDLSLVP